MNVVSEPPAGISNIEQHSGPGIRTLVNDLLNKDPDARLHDPAKLKERIPGIAASNIPPNAGWWKTDWPPEWRDEARLLDFLPDERSWFLSGKLRWAGALIGLHTRRRKLGEFHILLCDLVGRLRLLESSLMSDTSGASESRSSRLLKLTEFLDSVTELLERVDARFRTIDDEAFHAFPHDERILRRFRRQLRLVARSLALTTPRRVAGSMIGPDEGRLTQETKIALCHLYHCGRVCLELIETTEHQLTDCSDQLVSLVAKIK